MNDHSQRLDWLFLDVVFDAFVHEYESYELLLQYNNSTKKKRFRIYLQNYSINLKFYNEIHSRLDTSTRRAMIRLSHFYAFKYIFRGLKVQRIE